MPSSIPPSSPPWYQGGQAPSRTAYPAGGVPTSDTRTSSPGSTKPAPYGAWPEREIVPPHFADPAPSHYRGSNDGNMNNQEGREHEPAEYGMDAGGGWNQGGQNNGGYYPLTHTYGDNSGRYGPPNPMDQNSQSSYYSLPQPVYRDTASPSSSAFPSYSSPHMGHSESRFRQPGSMPSPALPSNKRKSTADSNEPDSIEAANALAVMGGYASTPNGSNIDLVGGLQGLGAALGRGSVSGKGKLADMSKKKKKKKSGTDGEGGPPEDGRRKTSRACDVCRTKKIRCDIIIEPSTDESADPSTNPHPQGLCAHCQHANLECTFFMPITETRFKRKKVDETAASPATSDSRPTNAVRGQPERQMSKGKERATDAVPHDMEVELPGGDPREQDEDYVPYTVTDENRAGRIEGPTSIAFLLHSTAALPRTAVESYDLRHHTTWAITSDQGDGVIKIANPPRSSVFASNPSPIAYTDSPVSAHGSVMNRQPSSKGILTSQLISSLVNSYFKHVAPIFPVVSKADFTKTQTPNPLLLYAMAGVASTRRGVPREVFTAIRGVINGLIRNNDILSDSSIGTVQSLLVLSMSGDLHSQPVATTVSACVARLGVAIRMCQDLGLHRESREEASSADEMAKIELKRRIWAGAVLMDRWYGASLGIPLLIDIRDCDCLLPSAGEIVPMEDPANWAISENQEYAHFAEHLKLTILMGRVLKTIYSPTGLTYATDDQLESLLNDITSWRESLPEHLQYAGPTSSHQAGLLHIAFVATSFLFWRVFMRLSYSCPTHLKITLTIAKWTELVEWSKQAIEWLDQNEEALDTLFVWAYCATSCALIQYHTWVRRKDPAALDCLRILKDVVIRWENVVQPDHMSIRRKTIEVLSLLHMSATKISTVSPSSIGVTTVLNPTPGVSAKQGEALKGVVFHRDPTRAGGGVFVASQPDTVKAFPPDLVVLHPATGKTLPAEPEMMRNLAVINGQPEESGGSEFTSNGNGGNSAGSGQEMEQQSSQWSGNGNGQGQGQQQMPFAQFANQLEGNNAQAMQLNKNLNPGLNNGNYVTGSGNGLMGSAGGVYGANGMGYDTDLLMNMLDQPLDASAFTQSGFDPNQNLLEGLPQASFDWNQWQEYFARVGVNEQSNGAGGSGSGAGGDGGFSWS